jgi:hypothetical protein
MQPASIFNRAQKPKSDFQSGEIIRAEIKRQRNARTGKSRHGKAGQYQTQARRAASSQCQQNQYRNKRHARRRKWHSDR